MTDPTTPPEPDRVRSGKPPTGAPRPGLVGFGHRICPRCRAVEGAASRGAGHADGVVLPWPECWRVTGGAKRLLGLTLPEVEQAAKSEFVGHGTCTHLNDTLRAMVDVAELAGLAAV